MVRYFQGIHLTILWCALFLSAYAVPIAVSAAESPNLLLARVYDESVDVREYWVSEKLDGVRAYWDGQHLISRQGNRIQAPDWFTADFPNRPLDGELWIGRGQFELMVGILNRHQPDESDWRSVGYYIFELPNERGDFSARMRAMRALVAANSSPWLYAVEQFRLQSRGELMEKLDRTVAAGGEGLMLHHQDAIYETGRSDALLKLKRYQDAEARVIGYMPGKGRHEGRMGSLIVELESGLQFRIGTGFSDKERESPPALGSLISFRHYGFTAKGTPRFASFLRTRQEF